MTRTADMKITTLAGWFGGNRTRAELVGKELGRLAWCAVPFCGGLPELPGIQTGAGVANDRHRHIINLARTVSDPKSLARLIRRVERKLFHPDNLSHAQQFCLGRESAGGLFGADTVPSETPDDEWAAAYFTACWMGRGGYAGREGEFSQSISTRWTSSGGSSSKRWRSAIESLPAWGEVLSRWDFVCMDAFEMLARLKGQEKAGVYCDPPWPDLGERYRHPFTKSHHRRLGRELERLSQLGYRVVVRYGDHPLIRSIYPDRAWTWIRHSTKNQQGGDVEEALIINGPSYASAT